MGIGDNMPQIDSVNDLQKLPEKLALSRGVCEFGRLSACEAQCRLPTDRCQLYSGPDNAHISQ